MKVLVIGSGGREHALCWKLKASRNVEALYCAPGNPGTANVAENINICADDLAGLADFAVSQAIDLTVVGPEQPLAMGLTDVFRERGLKVFGPSKSAAQLEASKSFAKEVMQAAHIPTAPYRVFAYEARSALEEYLRECELPVVLKADGLAAGKGVFVCSTAGEIDVALSQLLTKFSSGKILVEKFLSGKEVSYIVATNGTDVVPFASSHDYKRIFDGQCGPNTGGMGAVSPSPHLTKAQETFVQERIIAPLLGEMRRRGAPFVGFLYAGLMVSENGDINVLEFNARMGDPECQVIMRRMRSDLAMLLMALAQEGGGPKAPEALAVRWDLQTAVCVVLAAEGYPGVVKTGDEIVGIELAESLTDAVVFHAGTAVNSKGRLVTAGGRVLNVVARGSDLSAARGAAYQACDYIQFRGRQLRRDIGL